MVEFLKSWVGIDFFYNIVKYIAKIVGPRIHDQIGVRMIPMGSSGLVFQNMNMEALGLIPITLLNTHRLLYGSSEYNNGMLRSMCKET